MTKKSTGRKNKRNISKKHAEPKTIFDTIKKPFLKVQDFFDNYIFNKPKNTIVFLSIFLFIILVGIQFYIIIKNNSIYNNNSDDILQYYPMLDGFINDVKNGTLSWFNLNNYFGASFFSNLYYVPLDVFTIFALLLSFIMPSVVAISTTELIKIIVGVILLMIYLSLKKYSNKTIFWIGIIYFINGGTVSFMNFPAFLSLTVYLPLALIVIHYYFEKKYWIVPIFVLTIVLHNFYLAYMVLAFTSLAYLLEYFKFNRFKIIDFLFKGFGFLSLLLIGILMSSVILLPAITFISEETLRTPVVFRPWILDLKFVELKLFKPEVYIRYFAKLYTPQRPVSFRGFLINEVGGLGDYKLEHVSNYVSMIGFVLMLMVFFMKGKISNIYKIMFGILAIFTFFPIFSTILSGTFFMELFANSDQSAYPYNRWLNLVPILQVLVIAHVVETHRFKTMNRIFMFIILGLVFVLGYILLSHYQNSYALALVNELPGQSNRDNSFVLENLKYDIKFMIGSLVILGVAALVTVFKKYQLFKIIILTELVLAVGYMFASSFGSTGRLEQFEEMHAINDFMEESIASDEFTRVYVEQGGFKLISNNYNQISIYPTNSKVFHSWSDSETDDLAILLFNSYERQSKEKLNFYSYYLSSFLGYRYILTNSSDQSFATSDNFRLVNSNERYSIYEVVYSSNFYVFDSYLSYEGFKTFARNTNSLSAERIFLLTAIIDEERYQDIYDLSELFDDFSEESAATSVIEGSVRSWTNFMVSETIDRTRLNSVDTSTYYVYRNYDVDYISGEIVLKDNHNPPSSYGEVFYLNQRDEELSCRVEAMPNDSSKTVIKCGQFFRPIDKIFVEKTDDLSSAPSYIKRLERAVDGSSYLVYNFDQINLDLTGKMIRFYIKGYETQRIFIEDIHGAKTESVNGLFMYEPDMKRIYVYKTGHLYQHEDLTQLRLSYSAFDVDLSLDNQVYDKSMIVRNGKIDLSFKFHETTTKNQIIVIPITYSDDWQFTSIEKYDKISVSGGFLGIIIPEGTSEVNITMKFVPKNIQTGLKLSLAGTVIFALVVSYPLLLNKLRRGKTNDESKVNSTSV